MRYYSEQSILAAEYEVSLQNEYDDELRWQEERAREEMEWEARREEEHS